MTEYGPVVIARPPHLQLTALLVVAASLTVLTVLLGSHYGPQSEVFGTVIAPADFGRYGVETAALGAEPRKIVVFRMPLQYVRNAARRPSVAIELPEVTDGLTHYVEGDIVSIENMPNDGADTGRDAEPAANRYRVDCLAIVVFRPKSRGQQQIEATPTHSIVTVRVRARAFGWPSLNAP